MWQRHQSPGKLIDEIFDHVQHLELYYLLFGCVIMRDCHYDIFVIDHFQKYLQITAVWKMT